MATSRAEYQRAYREANAEKIKAQKAAKYASDLPASRARSRAQAKAYRTAHPERVRASYLKHVMSEVGRERVRASALRWYHKNKNSLAEKLRSRSAAYKAAHPEQTKRYRREYWENNKAALKAKRLTKKAADPEHFRAIWKKSADKNRGGRNASTREWNKANGADSRQRRAGKIKETAARRRAACDAAAKRPEVVEFYERVSQASGLRCSWCREVIQAGMAQVDHIIPIAKGGAHDLLNFAVTCRRCNCAKSDRLPSVFMRRCSYAA